MVEEGKKAISFDGWQFSSWLKGNWKTIKEVAKVGCPLIVGWLTTHDPYIAGFVTLIGKFLLDCGEYYVKGR